ADPRRLAVLVARLSARSAPRVAVDTASPFVARGGPAMLTRCRLAVLVRSPPGSLRSSARRPTVASPFEGGAGPRCSLAAGWPAARCRRARNVTAAYGGFMSEGAANDVPPGMVDWDLAVSTARRLARPGPEVPRSEADAAVTQLRALAEAATDHVQRITGLTAPDTLPARVGDRPGGGVADAAGVQTLRTPLVAKLTEQRAPGRLASSVGPRVTGLQAGAVLAFLSSKVLGQYEIFGAEGGMLLLVAPNVVEAERSLEVDPADFRLWVCLHEVTHRVQFTAVPWLSGHLREEVARLVEATELDPEALRERLGSRPRELGNPARG